MPRINYKLKDGTKVSGVTTILKNCGWSADALIGWAYNQGRDGKDRYETSKDAAEIGTSVHYRIECYLKKIPADEEYINQFSEEQKKSMRLAYDNFINWIVQNNIEILHIEPHLVSEQLKYGGTPDLIGKMNNKYVLIDWKSSRKIYSDYYLQLGGYRQLIWENYDYTIYDIHLLRFSKIINGWDHIYREFQEWMFGAFKCCLDLHNYKKIAEEIV